MKVSVLAALILVVLVGAAAFFILAPFRDKEPETFSPGDQDIQPDKISIPGEEATEVPHEPRESTVLIPPTPIATRQGPAVVPSDMESPDIAPAATPPVEPDAEEAPQRLNDLHAAIRGAAYTMVNEGGPTAMEHAMMLLGSNEPTLRALGAALLSELGVLDNRSLRDLAGDTDLAVPIMVMEWLNDSGKRVQAEELAHALALRRVDAAQVKDLLLSGALNAGGSRAALELLAVTATPQEVLDIYLTLAADEAQSYSIRMKALIDLKDQLSFRDYRREVMAVNEAVSSEETAWAEGVQRLADTLQGPTAVQAAKVLSADDIDQALAHDRSTMLEDLALSIEYVLTHDDTEVEPGAADRLKTHISQLADQPWSGEQRTALQRLSNAVIYLEQVELERPAETSVNRPPGF